MGPLTSNPRKSGCPTYFDGTLLAERDHCNFIVFLFVFPSTTLLTHHISRVDWGGGNPSYPQKTELVMAEAKGSLEVPFTLAPMPGKPRDVPQRPPVPKRGTRLHSASIDSVANTSGITIPSRSRYGCW